MKTLPEGLYKIPDDCTFIIEKKVIKVRKKFRHDCNELRCEDCAFFTKGFANAFTWFTTTVCLKRPKVVRKRNPKNTDLHYHQKPRGKICEHFKQKNYENND